MMMPLPPVPAPLMDDEEEEEDEEDKEEEVALVERKGLDRKGLPTAATAGGEGP